MELNFTLLKQRATPLYQLALALAIGLGGMVVSKMVHAESGTEYFAAMVAIILYVLINTVVSLAYTSYFRYTIPSYYVYVALVVILFLSAKLFSGISIWTLPIYRDMVTSVSIFYLVVSTLVRVIRLIYEAAEKDI
ncbi:MAG: hypothetical protein V4615_16095 [Bacteroidota bacterium]